jgi:choloylglycine hydrolase
MALRWFQRILIGGVVFATIAGSGDQHCRRSCATLVLARGAERVVGHNLDGAVPVPGLVVVNPRGLAKENRTLMDLEAGTPLRSAPRIRWVSKYGSLTYNVFGREFPDGGLNEAGLYVGEMTLMATRWPTADKLPRLYHHQWIQYLLDNCATVDEALASLAKALPEGHCRWHFLLADRAGGVAVLEFLEGKVAIYRGATLPYPILCNDAYQAELKDIVNYAGFGGTKDPTPRYVREDPRFRWAAVMMRSPGRRTSAVDEAFTVLKRMDLGTTKWSVAYDLPRSRMYFRTSVASGIRWVDLSALDFSCTRAPLALDIHSAREGDVARAFTPLTGARHAAAVAAAWKEIDAGLLGNLFFKPLMVRGLGAAPAAFACATP